MHVKPKSKTILKNVVYKIPCADCNSVYIGETRRHIHKRFNEHKQCILKEIDIEKASENQNFSRLALHAKIKKHNINWEKATVIRSERKTKMRKVLEALAMYCGKEDAKIISQPSFQIATAAWLPLLKDKKIINLSEQFKAKCTIPVVEPRRRQQQQQQTAPALHSAGPTPARRSARLEAAAAAKAARPG
jgi:hypothetical protein